MKNKKLLALALSMAVAAGCTACGGGQASTDTSAAGDASKAESTASGDNTVIVAMGSGFSTLDPGYVYEKYPQLIVNACYENLFKFYENNGTPQPCLADTYEFSEDGLTLTVTLKDGLTFASGNKITSADVAFSINRTKNLKGNPSFICDTIDSIETPDDATVIFHLNQPDSAILSKLTYTSLAILDSAVVKENGGTDAEDASSTDTAQSFLDNASAGSGMYILTSYTPDEEVVLEKNPNYWGTSTNVDKYILKIQPDANTQMMTLSTGDIDVALNLTDDTLEELGSAENVEIVNGTTKMIGFVMMNMNEEYGGPVSNPDVQKAIRKALDYSGIRMICGDGTLTPYSIIQDGFMGSKGTRPDDYTNIEEAKQLLADAGYPDGFDMTIMTSAMYNRAVEMAEIIAEELKEIGINAKLEVVERAVFTSAWASFTPDEFNEKFGWDMFIMGSGGDSDADTLLKRILHSDDTNVNNYGFYNNAEVDELLEKGAVTMDETERNAIYARIAQITLYEDPFGAYMNLRKNVYALSDKIEGFAVNPSNTMDLAHVRCRE